jgi:HD-GYP domain-containing protein (c-di-GMP phosphodiesterase class II)
MLDIESTAPRLNTGRLDLLEKIWNRVRPQNDKHEFIASVMQVTRHALNAAASSLLTLDSDDQELVFQFADGPVGNQLKRLHIDKKSGIAGWVIKNGKPLIVNDTERNKNFCRQIDEATGFKTKSIIGVPLVIGDKITGVIESLNKQDGTDFNQHDLRMLTRIARTAALGLEKIKENVDMLNSYKGTVRALVALADAKETSGEGHSKRVAEYALIATSGLSLSKEEKQVIEYAAILHDIGKLGVPDGILNKTGKLNDEEWELLHKHPVTGWELLCDIPFLKEASELILYHHEQYDGTGYPQGLKGEEIPLGSRIISVANAFDNMTTEHSYRAALSRRDAFKELYRCTGSQFCPVAVKAFTSSFVKSRLSGI